MLKFRFLAVCALILAASSAQAGSVLDRVRSEGVIRCGGEERPGLIAVAADGRAQGLYLDICKAIAAAVLPPTGRIEFYLYEAPKTFDPVRNGEHDVSFLSASEIAEYELAGRVVPGAAVFYQTTAVMIPETSPEQSLKDLAGQVICFYNGSNAEQNLNAWFAARHLDLGPHGYSEDIEMHDAYNAQRCHGMAAEVTTLARHRLDGGINKLRSRILPDVLAAFPIMANTSTKDAEWSALVAWVVHTLVRADAAGGEWQAAGLDSIAISAPELGLEKDWQKRVVAAAGTYAEIYRRNVGEGSPLRLPRGLNALWQDGGVMLVPHLE